jgi:hypothetical protein
MMEARICDRCGARIGSARFPSGVVAAGRLWDRRNRRRSWRPQSGTIENVSAAARHPFFDLSVNGPAKGHREQEALYGKPPRSSWMMANVSRTRRAAERRYHPGARSKMHRRRNGRGYLTGESRGCRRHRGGNHRRVTATPRRRPTKLSEQMDRSVFSSRPCLTDRSSKRMRLAAWKRSRGEQDTSI